MTQDISHITSQTLFFPVELFKPTKQNIIARQLQQRIALKRQHQLQQQQQIQLQLQRQKQPIKPLSSNNSNHIFTPPSIPQKMHFTLARRVGGRHVGGRHLA